MTKNKLPHHPALEHILILLLGLLLLGGTLYKTGTLSSGYHFLDDHEVIRYHSAFAKGDVSLGTLIRTAISSDSTRFRPMYWAERITAVRFFGDEMFYWNCYTAVKGILAFYLLYFTARYLNFNRMISFLFTGIILFGAQFTPWYRSANQENTGLLLCAFTLFLISVQYRKQNYDDLFLNLLITVSAVICGLIKESFILFMPAFAALKLWLEYCEKGKFLRCLKKNLPVYGGILLAALIYASILLFFVGVDKVSYAGFHEGIHLNEYWSGIQYSLNYHLRGYTIAGAALLFAIFMFLNQLSGSMKKKYVGFILIDLYIVVTQLVAHAKSLMWERYIIPCIVGYALLIVLLGYHLFQQDRWKKVLYVSILALLLLSQAPKAYTMSRDYTYNGSLVRLYFQNILDNTEENSQIICAFFDAELNLASECWLEAHGRTLVYSFDTVEEEFINYAQLAEPSPETFSWETATVITCYTDQAEQLWRWPGFPDEDQYSISEYGTYCVISIQNARRTTH